MHALALPDADRFEPQDPAMVASQEDPARYPDEDAESKWEGGFVGMLGWRELKGNAFEAANLEDHGFIGAEFDFKPIDSILGFEVGIFSSGARDNDTGNTNVDLSATTFELGVGPRLTFEAGAFHPYVGSGISLLVVSQERLIGTRIIDEEEEATVAGYVHGGFYFEIQQHLRLGADVRYVYGADYTLFGNEVGSDLFQLGIFFGGSF